MKTGLFLAYHSNQLLWGSLDWFFPPACGGCTRIGYCWCPNCQSEVQNIPEPVCQICGLPLEHPGLCNDCKNSRPPYEAMRSRWIFEGPIRKALHSLKYRRNVPLGDTLAQCMVKHVACMDWQVDMLVPVPLGRQRMLERGYNQVGLVAMPLAARLGWNYIPQALSRTSETRSQVGLSPVERKENVSGAFHANKSIVTGKKVLLMDDVATTGATLAACATELLKAGAKVVYGLTLARALPHHGLLVV
jgi:competence protein ComFC